LEVAGGVSGWGMTPFFRAEITIRLNASAAHDSEYMGKEFRPPSWYSTAYQNLANHYERFCFSSHS
jgi:hypothetical protein